MMNVGNSIIVIIAGRILHGISEAIVFVVGLALILDTVDSTEVGQYMGYVGFALSMAFLLSPLLSGVVYTHGGYNTVYGMVYGLIAVDIFLRVLLVEKRVAGKWLQANTEGRQHQSEQSSEQNSSPDGELKNLPDASKIESTTAGSGNTGSYTGARLPPVVTLLRSLRLLAALWGVFVRSLLFNALDTVQPLFAKRTFRWDSQGAGEASPLPYFSKPRGLADIQC